MQYNTLISDITSDIYSNGYELITGDILQGVLLDMVSALAGAGATYGGVITPASAAPADLDQATVYLALDAGTYTNFVDSSNNPIVTTGPALINFDGGATLVFSKTDLPSGGGGSGIGATQVVWDVNGPSATTPYLDIQLTDQHGAFRIDMSAAYSGGYIEKFVGSLIIGVDFDGAVYGVHSYYYGDDLDLILHDGLIYVYDDIVDAHIIMEAEPGLDLVVWNITPLDDLAFQASLVASAPGTLAETVTPTPIGGVTPVTSWNNPPLDTNVPSEKLVYDSLGKYGVVSQTQTWSGSGVNPRTYVMSNLVECIC